MKPAEFCRTPQGAQDAGLIQQALEGMGVDET